MEFTSLIFLALFLPVTMLFYLAVPPSWRLATLCIFSLVFYASAGWLAFAFLVVTILWGYFASLLIEKRRSLARLRIGRLDDG